MLWNDFVFALRMLRRSPLYAVACIATLVLAIGATAAVFGVVDATLLRPLPYADPDRLVMVPSMQPDANGADTAWAPTQIEYIRWRERGSTLEGMEALEPRSLALTSPGDPMVVDGGLVTSGFFSILGVRPMMGRVFTAGEE